MFRIAGLGVWIYRCCAQSVLSAMTGSYERYSRLLQRWGLFLQHKYIECFC